MSRLIVLGFTCFCTLCLLVSYVDSDSMEPGKNVISCDLTGLHVEFSRDSINDVDTLDLVVQSIPSGVLISKSSRRIFNDSVKQLGYQIPLSQLLEPTKLDDEYLKVVLLGNRSSKPSEGAVVIEERYYRVKDLRELRN